MTRTTRAERHIKAPRELVYALLTDPDAVQKWKVPERMSSHIHKFDAREGGTFRVSLTYSSPESAGKSSEHTDTYHGRFISLVRPKRIVETMEFETDDPMMRGEMTISYTLSVSGNGTDILAVHEDVPPGVALADNEVGWRMAMDKLKELAETLNNHGCFP